MSETFGQAFRQETQEVKDGGNIAPKNTDVTGRSVAQASAKGTVDSNFTRNDTPEQKRINTDTGKILSALMSVAGAGAEVITKESNRQKVLEGERLAGTEDGREAIDGMADGFLNKIFGPGATQRAGQARIVRDTTIELSGKLANDAGTVGLGMSEKEWNAHVDDTIASQTAKYDDEEIKDQITGDFAKRLGTIQAAWIKKSTVYQQEVSREGYAKTTDAVFTQYAGALNSVDPQEKADAQEAVRDAMRKPAGMTDEAHRDQLTNSLEQQLTKGNIEVYDAVKATGAFDQLDQHQQDALSTMESAYKAKNNVEYLANMAAIDTMIKQTNPDGSPKNNPAEIVEMLHKQRARNPEAFTKLGMGSQITKLMEQQEAWNVKEREAALLVQDVTLGISTTSAHASKQDRQTAYSTILKSKLTASVEAERDPSMAGQPVTQQELDAQLISNPDAYKVQWSNFGEPSIEVGDMGRRVHGRLMNVEADSPEDPALMAGLRTMKELYDTDRTLFTKQFPDEAGDIVDLYQRIEEFGQRPWAAVTNMAALRDSIEKNGGKPREMPANFDKRIDKELQKLLDGGENQGLFNFGDNGYRTAPGWMGWTNIEASNYSEIRDELARQARDQYQISGDMSQAASKARVNLMANGIQIGESFIIGGQKANDNAYGNNVANFLKGLDDDPDMNALLTESYGVPEGTSFFSAFKKGRVNAEGTEISGYLHTSDDTLVPFMFKIPTKADHILPTNKEQIAISAKGILNAGVDAVGTALELASDLTSEGGQGHSAAFIEHKRLLTKEERKEHTYYGLDAVREVSRREGRDMSYPEKRVIEEEGFVDGYYPDTKGIITGGVGQTNEYMDMNFDETYKAHEDKLTAAIPGWRELPEFLQGELMQSAYRGGILLSHDTQDFANAGKWEEASVEFLDNDEYRNPATPESIKARMRKVANAMAAYGQSL